MNARVANSSSTIEHRFPWKWYLSDLSAVSQNGLNVFSCFACGGGSSMGYKLAGCNVLGNCEIDPSIADVYNENLHPKHSFVMDVRDFLKLPDDKIPGELFGIDILDGSPPCSTFSLAGQREKSWGKHKKFAEGQKLQRLDDLFFVFIEIAERLRPKVIIAENVKGLIMASAKGYVHEISRNLNEIGYDVQLFLLNAMYMGVPQMRERVFFIARRKDMGMPAVALDFDELPIVFGQVREKRGKPFAKPCKTQYLLQRRKNTDSNIGEICARLGMKRNMFNAMIHHDERVAYTLTAGGGHYRYSDGLHFTDMDYVNVSTFPQDYNFLSKDVKFICGMSVPPVMMAGVAAEVVEQLFGVSECRVGKI